MRSAELPADIRRFILTSIPSIPYLEAVLLLRAEPQTDWDAGYLARRLYVSDRQAGELLQSLAEAGIAVPREAPGHYAFGPPDELRERLDTLAQVYATHLMAVTDLVHSRIDKRAQQFADAFRWRKEK